MAPAQNLVVTKSASKIGAGGVGEVYLALDTELDRKVAIKILPGEVAILNELSEMSKQAYVSPYDMAILYVGLGDKDRAFEQLNKAYDDRAGFILYLNVEPLFDPLRSDPRFPHLGKQDEVSALAWAEKGD